MAEFIYHILIERQLRKGGTNEIILKKLVSFYHRVVSCEAAAVMTDAIEHSPMLPPCLFPSPSGHYPPPPSPLIVCLSLEWRTPHGPCGCPAHVSS